MMQRATSTRAKEALKDALRRAGRALPRREGSRVVVLCYHSVHPSAPFRSATPELFSDHLAWLRETCECIPFRQVLEAKAADRGDCPTVSITFDDGYSDNHEFALPLLVSSGMKATFFLTAGLVDEDPATLERFRRLRAVDVIQSLGWEQAAELLQSGMEVGAHTYSHRNLANLSDSELRHEVTHSKQLIEDRMACGVTTMAYPFGRPRVHFDERVLDAVQQAGYEFAGTTTTRGVRTSDRPLSVPRMISMRDSVETLRDKVLGAWDLIGSVREKAPLALSKLVSPSDFEF